MKKFKDYIAEEKSYEKGTLTIFDIDDTLFHTTAKINVVKDGKVVRELSNQEFNTYKLGAGEEFDFSQFKDAEKFNRESTPIKKMFDKARNILRSTERHPNNRVVIITARTNLDDRETFLDTFRKHGLDVDKIRIERAGNIGGGLFPAEQKAIIIRNILKTKQFNKVKMFDDSISNLAKFLKLKNEFDVVKFEAFLADKKGSVVKVK